MKSVKINGRYFLRHFSVIKMRFSFPAKNYLYGRLELQTTHRKILNIFKYRKPY